MKKQPSELTVINSAAFLVYAYAKFDAYVPHDGSEAGQNRHAIAKPTCGCTPGWTRIGDRRILLHRKISA